MARLTKSELKRQLTGMHLEKKVVHESITVYIRDSGPSYTVYVEGSTNFRHWANNATAFAPAFSYVPGYSIAAKHLEEVLRGLSKPFYLIGHSRGASVSLVWAQKYGGRSKLIHAHMLAPNVSHGIFNFRKPKKSTIYIKRDDLIRLSKLIFVWYKLPKIEYICLPKTPDESPIDDHLISSYLEVL